MADKTERKGGLGRGLSALMADIEPARRASDTQESANDAAPRRADTMVPIDRIEPNPDQPRRLFEGESLEELAASIAARGIIQPLIVRPHPDREGYFQIVAGERRWRASQIAKLHELPVIVRTFDDTEMLEVAIIENIQRADLNPVDEAAGYRQLMDRFGRTQEQMADALGKSRSHIANTLRLLALPDTVQDWLAQGKLTAGHARALIPADNATDLARQVIAKSLSVRQTEALLRKPASSGKRKQPIENAEQKDADTRALEQDLSAAMGVRVTIDHSPNGDRGQLSIHYTSLEKLDDICQLLSRGLGLS